MARRVKVRQARNTLYVSIPKRFVSQLQIAAGDLLHVSVTREGLLLSPYDPDVERAIRAYERLYRRYRGDLRALPW